MAPSEAAPRCRVLPIAATKALVHAHSAARPATMHSPDSPVAASLAVWLGGALCAPLAATEAVALPGRVTTPAGDALLALWIVSSALLLLLVSLGWCACARCARLRADKTKWDALICGLGKREPTHALGEEEEESGSSSAFTSPIWTTPWTRERLLPGGPSPEAPFPPRSPPSFPPSREAHRQPQAHKQPQPRCARPGPQLSREYMGGEYMSPDLVLPHPGVAIPVQRHSDVTDLQRHSEFAAISARSSPAAASPAARSAARSDHCFRREAAAAWVATAGEARLELC